jgi:hypothetical protein
MNYRVYLIGADDRIKASESFCVEDDKAAQEVALALHENCSSSFQGIELWRGPTMVMRRTETRAPRPLVNIRKLQDKRQEIVLRLEEMLERSFECVRQSKQLMLELEKVRLG